MDDQFDTARHITRRLREAGFEAYFAGGCVRDHLLGRTPKDVDIATDARPEEVEKLFRNTIGVGRHFGVMIVVVSGRNFDVATFRSDGPYADGRRPETVTYSSAREDVLRRDFTINGLLMDPESGEVIDHVGGREDLAAGVIRTIGDPQERFGEDHLRILRAVRFACRFGFRIEDGTRKAIYRLSDRASSPSAERIFGELDRMFRERSPGMAFELLEELGILKAVLPGVARLTAKRPPARLGTASPADSLCERKTRILKHLGGPLPAALPWAVVLGDLVDGSPVERARVAEKSLEELRASRDLIRSVGRLVLLRDRLLFACRVSRARMTLLRSDAELDLLVALRRAEEKEARREDVVARPVEPPACERPAPLLDGREMMAAGVPSGRPLGRALRRLRFLQLDGRLENRDEALAWVGARYD